MPPNARGTTATTLVAFQHGARSACETQAAGKAISTVNQLDKKQFFVCFCFNLIKNIIFIHLTRAKMPHIHPQNTRICLQLSSLKKYITKIKVFHVKRIEDSKEQRQVYVKLNCINRLRLSQRPCKYLQFKLSLK